MTRTGVYDGDDIRATFTHSFEQTDPNPSIEDGMGDVECVSLEILGVRVDYAALPPDLKTAILALADGIEFE